jgi:D-alanyl-D-alanine carboxypeptidase
VDYLVLVNNSIAADDAYFDDLSLVNCTNILDESILVEEKTYNEYLKLRGFLKTKNIFIELDSGYRSLEQQQEIINEFTRKKGKEYTKKHVAPISKSEHHTGLALDIALIVNGIKYYENEDLFNFEEIFLEIHKYLSKFGFIFRYPKGKEKITGYDYEPWHIRYVGYKPAEDIYMNNLTLEEYLFNNSIDK